MAEETPRLIVTSALLLKGEHKAEGEWLTDLTPELAGELLASGRVRRAKEGEEPPKKAKG